MKTFLVLVLLALMACAAPLRATQRTRATNLLEDCLDHQQGYPARQRCLQESIQYCRSIHLEDACGSDGMWGKQR